MTLQTGTRLQHYEILGPLGSGGMGEVYRAADTKLKREVAIKILPAPFANDPDRLVRFEREAQALASLNHANIATIYGLEHVGDVRFIVLELVQGPTLAEKIAQQPMDVQEALRIAAQISAAIEVAHDKGIVHRDLKPANVKLTPDGKVKVLDFGLAKALAGPDSVPDPADSPTLIAGQTHAGLVLGTAAYMSPEQASGKSVDKRTDIWSFGVVLYEMLSGRKAFDGKTVSHILVQVLEKDPDWSALPPLPSALQHLLEHCLQKDPANRLRDMGDLRVMLESLLTRPIEVHPTPAVAHPILLRRSAAWIAAAAAAILAGVLGFMYTRQKPPVVEAMRFEIVQPSNANVANILAISPDGRRLGFIASAAAGLPQLWVRSLETLESRPIPGTEGVNGIPFWSEDSRYLIFGAQGRLKKVDLSGGPAIPLSNVDGTAIGGFSTPDDNIVFSSGQRLWRVPARGGTPAPIETSISRRPLFPQPLPDGHHYVFCACGDNEAGITIGSLDGKEQPKQVLPDFSPVRYAPSTDPALGYLLFIRGAQTISPIANGTLMAQAIRTDTWSKSGEAIPIAEHVAFSGFSASRTGVLVYGTGSAGIPMGIPGMVEGQLTWFDRQGRTLTTIGDPGVYRVPTLSPDGNRIAFEVVDRQTANLDVWLFEAMRGVFTRFTFASDRDISPIWSHDAQRIIFARLSPGRIAWYARASNMAGDEVLVFNPPGGGAASSWSPDGRFLLYNEVRVPADIWAVDISQGTPETRQPIPVVKSEFNEINARFSPDGKYFAYASNESGAYEIYVRPFDGANSSSAAAGGKWMVSQGAAGEGGAVWRPDGKELFYVAEDTMMSVEVSTNPVFTPQTPKRLFKLPAGIMFFDVTRDGQRFLAAVPVTATAATLPYKIILNWTATLKR